MPLHDCRPAYQEAVRNLSESTGEPQESIHARWEAYCRNLLHWPTWAEFVSQPAS
jgi:hypothetical protein